MAATKPNRVQYAWKYADQKLDVFTKDLLKWLDSNNDSNSTLAGVQNIFDLNSVIFRADCPGIDVFAIGISPSGNPQSPGFWLSGLKVIVKESGYIDSFQKTFKILAPSKAANLSLEDHLVTLSGEIMRIEDITTGSPYYTLTVERGAHGTDAAVVEFDGELELLTPRCGMKRIILAGDPIPLAPPSLDSINGISEGILLQWSHGYGENDLAKLNYWTIYYSETSNIDITNTSTYDGTIEVAGDQLLKIFNPLKHGVSDTDAVFYFVITATTKSLVESVTASNELSGKAYGSIMPNPNGPFVPIVEVSVNGNYRIITKIRKPTGENPALSVADASEVDFELYYAPAGLGNPTTGEIDENQIRIGEFADTAWPYQYERVCNDYGNGDYWARVKVVGGFISQLDVFLVGSWVASEKFLLTDLTSTPDTEKATGVYVAMAVNGKSPFDDRTMYFVNVSATGNFQSASYCEIAFRINKVGDFQPKEDDPFLGATDSYSKAHKSGGFPGVYTFTLAWNVTWEVTARVYNAHGWSDWADPVPIDLLKKPDSSDISTCNLSAFGAWTIKNPHPDVVGDVWPVNVPKPGPQQVTFTYELPSSNSSSVRKIGILGTEAENFPEETVLKSQADGIMTAEPGALQVIVAGFYATENQFADKFLRLGIDPGKNNTDVSLQVLPIASNTAGNPFYITISGSYAVMNLKANGAVSKWQIIEKPIWDLCDYKAEIDVTPDQLGALPAQKGFFYGDSVLMKFMAYAWNVWGNGAKRVATTNAVGSATIAEAEYKEISGVGTDGLTDGAVTTPKLGDGAVTTEKTEKKLQPIAVDLDITCIDHRGWSWGTGSVEFPGGITQSISSGSDLNNSTNTTYWGYMEYGSSILTFTPSQSLANGANKIVIAVVRTVSLPSGDTVTTCKAAVMFGEPLVVGNLSAISGDFGLITAGTVVGITIKTSLTAETTGGIVMNGTDFTVYDTDGDILANISKTGIKIYDSSGNIGTSLDHDGIVLYYGGAYRGLIDGEDHGVFLSVDADHTLRVTSKNFYISIDGDIDMAGNIVIGKNKPTQFPYLTAWVDGSGDPGIRYNRTTSKWQFSNNGTDWVDF